MKLSNRYNIPQETLDRMVKDGLIGCQWPTYEAVYEHYLSLKGTGKTHIAIYGILADKFKISDSSAKQIVLKMGKILCP